VALFSFRSLGKQRNSKSHGSQRKFARRSRLGVESLETRQMLAVTLNPINAIQEPGGKDVLVPLTGVDSDGAPITYTFSSSNPNVSVSLVSAASKSLKLNVSGVDGNETPFTGTLTIHLFEDLVPGITARFEQLVTQGFFNNTAFGRVLDGFIAQGPYGLSGATAGQQLSTGQKLNDEIRQDLLFASPGLLAMANAGADTNDANFFITATQPANSSDPISLAQMPQFLNYRYTIFGQLVAGFDTFDKIMSTDVVVAPGGPDGNNPSKPVTNVVVTSAELVTDTQNAVLRVSAPTSAIDQTSTIVVTATGGNNNTAQQSFVTTVVTDSIVGNSNFVPDPPFLGPVPTVVTTSASTPTTLTLTSTNIHNQSQTYFVVDAATGQAPANVTVSINQATGVVTLTPASGFTGVVNLLAAVGSEVGQLDSSFDTQRFALNVTAAGTSLSLANQSAAQGATVSVPITLSNPHPAGTSGLFDAVIGLTYDPARFDVATGDIQLGSLTSSGWTIASNIDAATGQIAITLTANSGQQITSTAAGTLAVINFHVKSNATIGTTPIRIESAVTPNGQQFSTELNDVNGLAITLSPAPTDDASTPVAANINITQATTPDTDTQKQVDLASAFNSQGLFADGTKFSRGIENGYALSSTRLGNTITWKGVEFDLGAAGANNLLSALGQTVNLTSGQFAKLAILAFAIDGHQRNQTFVVRYTDGTTSTLNQDISDWHGSNGFTGESVAETTFRNKSNGKAGKNEFELYAYTLDLNPAKTVASITLPNNSDVKVLALTELKAVSSPTGLTATSSSTGQVNLAWTAPSGTVTGYNVFRGTAAGGESTTPLNSSPLAANATSYTDTKAVLGTKYFYVVKALNGAVSSANSNEVSVTPANTVSTNVDLASAFNLAGITANGASIAGGLDGAGHALSSNQLGTSLNSNGVVYKIGAAGGNNVISATGQTINLTSGQFSKLSLLAVGTGGSQLDQTFTVKYTDNTTSTLTQDISDWVQPLAFTGEKIAKATLWNSSQGSASKLAFVYSYTITLDATKTVSSITLPNNSNVKVIAITEVQ
jgi:cyclophilin family peptidyl-prolyl cis-trans isomerase